MSVVRRAQPVVHIYLVMSRAVAWQQDDGEVRPRAVGKDARQRGTCRAPLMVEGQAAITLAELTTADVEEAAVERHSLPVARTVPSDVSHRMRCGSAMAAWSPARTLTTLAPQSARAARTPRFSSGALWGNQEGGRGGERMWCL